MAGISKRKIIGKYIVPVFALLILLGITLAAVLYSAGVYDFVFIERPEEEDTEVESVEEETQRVVEKDTSGNLSAVFDPESIITVDDDDITYNSLISAMPKASELAGQKEISSGVFDADRFVIARADSEAVFPSDYSQIKGSRTYVMEIMVGTEEVETEIEVEVETEVEVIVEYQPEDDFYYSGETDIFGNLIGKHKPTTELKTESDPSEETDGEDSEPISSETDTESADSTEPESEVDSEESQTESETQERTSYRTARATAVETETMIPYLEEETTEREEEAPSEDTTIDGESSDTEPSDSTAAEETSNIFEIIQQGTDIVAGDLIGTEENVYTRVETRIETILQTQTVMQEVCIYEEREVTEETDIPTVTLYQGLIITNTQSGRSVYNKDGVLLAEKIPYQAANKTTAQGEPLFTDGEELYMLENGTFLPFVGNEKTLISSVYGNDFPDYYTSAECGLYPYFEVIEPEEPETEAVDTEGVEVSEEETEAEEAEAEIEAESEIEAETEAETEAEAEEEAEEEEEILWGYVDSQNNVVIEPQYLMAYNFCEDGLAAAVTKDGYLVVINTAGRVVVDFSGKTVYLPERGGRASRDGLYPAKDYELDIIGMYYYTGGYMRVRRVITDFFFPYNEVRSTDIIIDQKGKALDIPGDYTIAGYSEGMILLRSTVSGNYGFMSVHGHWIAQPIYTYAQPFCEGLAVIGFEGGKKAMIDLEGAIVVPFAFDYISNSSKGVIAAYEAENGWSIYHKLEDIDE